MERQPSPNGGSGGGDCGGGRRDGVMFYIPEADLKVTMFAEK